MNTATILPGYRLAIPKAICEALALMPGSQVECTVQNGICHLTPIPTSPPAQHPPPPRPSGLCKGHFTVPDDFNEIDITQS